MEKCDEFRKPPIEKYVDRAELKRGSDDGHGESKGTTNSDRKGPKGKAVLDGGEPKWKSESVHSEQTDETKSKETWYSYLVLAVSLYACFVSDGLETAYGVIYQDLKTYYSASAFRLSLPVAILTFMTQFGALFTSAFVNVFGVRAAGFIGALVSAGGFIVAYFAPSLEIFTVAYGVIVGSGFSFIYLAGGIAIQIYFDRNRSIATGVFYAGSALGVFTMSPLLRFLMNKYTWRGTMLILAGIALQCTWTFSLVRPIANKEEKKDHVTQNQTSVTSHEPEMTSSFRYKKLEGKPGLSQKLLTTLKETFDFSLFKNFHFTVYLLAIFISEMGFPVAYAFAPDKGTDMGFSFDDTKWFTSFIGFGGLLGRLFFGLIGNFSLLQDRRLYLHMLSVGLTGISLISVPFCRDVTSMYITFSMYGFTLGGHIVMTPAVLCDLFGSDVITRSYGLSVVAMGLASVVAIPLSGFIRDKTDAYDPVFFLAGGYFLLSLCIMLLIPVTKRREDKNKEQYFDLS